MASNKNTRKKSTNANTRPKRRTRRTVNQNTEKQNYLRDEIIILSTLAVCLLLLISHFGIGGFVGNEVSAFLFGVFGFMAYIVPILLFIGIVFVLSNKGNTIAYIKTGASCVLFLMCCTLFQIFTKPELIGADITTIYQDSSVYKDGGGVLGGLIVNLLWPAIEASTYVVVIILCIICFVIISGKSFIGTVKKESEKAYQSAKERAIEQREKRAIEKAQQKEQEQNEVKRKDKVVSGVSFNTTLAKEPTDIHEITPPESSDSLFRPTKPEDIVIKRSMPIAEPTTELVSEQELSEPEQMLPDAVSKEDAVTRRRRSTIESRESAANEAINVENEIKKSVEKPKKAYKFPPINLLTRGRATGGDSDAHLRETAMKLEQTLQNFNVNVTVTNVSCGPSVTRYELQPEQGVKVSKIVGLADDIKLNLAASDIRIEAPIPGKAAVGIEVPNKENTAVMLRDLLESAEFKSHPSKLAFAVGRDIAGKVVVADIAKMPHVLIAGATGSGKSVCINTLIMSILYKAHPDDVKLIMIDPKVVELNVYNGIPHLLIPVVTDTKKASAALAWGVAEMTERYKKFAENEVRDLKGYNQKAEQCKTDANGEELKKMPQIVIIVDELADLMMVAAKEVEESICRLAQLARAAGIHLIIATQRPSVDVITGLIKANMPSRIAFSVTSGVDSRTILDTNGAEKLLGKGDMLFFPQGYSKPTRVQGAFVSDEDVVNVVDFIRNQSVSNDYAERIEEVISSVATSEQSGFTGGDERDLYFVDAAKFVIEKDKGSIGMLQRVFKIGFNRAARIMDQLEAAGIVGPEEGTKPRRILMTLDELETYLSNH